MYQGTTGIPSPLLAQRLGLIDYPPCRSLCHSDSTRIKMETSKASRCRCDRAPTTANRRFRIEMLLAIAMLASRVLTGPVHAQHLDVDLLVYGASSAGVIAAYTASHYGKSVVLVEPGRHLGGMSSGGLGHTDIGNKYAVTGLGLDYYRRLGRYYGRFEAWQFEPRAAAQVFESYVDEADVEVLYSRRLSHVEKEGTRIRSVTLAYGGDGPPRGDLTVRAAMFIDASYEGDLMALSGASYTVGRESNEQYGETWNGVQMLDGHQFPEGIDPYLVRGDPSSGLVAEITGMGVAEQGSGDRGVQAYNFRMCLCQTEDRIPITEPDAYDPARYELLVRRIEAEQTDSLNQLFIISRMPNGKTDWNNRGGFSTDYIGRNWDYPEAAYSDRARIWQTHVDYQKGLLYFIATNERIPAHLREEMQGWGYCKDEFLDTDGWPHQLYVREARRLVGEYVMTQHNCEGREAVEDGIGMAAYTMDSHNVQRVVVDGPEGPMVKNEGNVEVGGFPPYPISYRSITPRREELINLLVPVALSASHIAYGSIRMEPVFMVLGQAAAVASAMAQDAASSVQEVDVAALQAELVANPLADGSTPEVLVDDRYEEQVSLSGDWVSATAAGQYGPSLLRANASSDGTVRFTAPVSSQGSYEVYLYWPPADDLATNVPVRIGHSRGTSTARINMLKPAEGVQHNIASWTPLGVYEFQPDSEAWLEIDAAGTDGAVVADAVLFVPVRE